MNYCFCDSTVQKVSNSSPAFRCHQMSDCRAKMHQIRFQLRLRPRLRWRSLQRSSDPLPVFKGPTSKGRESGRSKEWQMGRKGGREGEREGK